MAIAPQTEYPGQTITTDTAYPHGKARNELVPGDGVGTPLEAAWVNDHFGFQQALLAAGGVAPSGLPDEVGASDYLTALNAVIAAAIAAGHVSINALIDASANFSPMPSRTVKIPMWAFQMYGDPSVVARLNSEIIGTPPTAELARVAIRAQGEAWAFARLSRFVPRGAVITQVRAAVDFYVTGASPAVDMTIDAYGVDFAAWVASGTTVADSTTALNSLALADGTGRKVMDSGAISRTMPADHGLTLMFRMEGNNIRIHEVEITFGDPGPRNF